MPKVIRTGPYRIYFYSYEPNEPPYVHIDREDQSSKFWLQPVALAHNLGYSAKELRDIEKIILENKQLLLRPGMTISEIKPGEGVKNVLFTEDTLTVDLIDGLTISVPLT